MPAHPISARRVTITAFALATAVLMIVAHDLTGATDGGRAGSFPVAATPLPSTSSTPPTTSSSSTVVTTTTPPRAASSASRPAAARPASRPVAAVPASPVRVSQPVSALGSAASYSFEGTNPDGTPYRWNPCAPIHYLISTANAPSPTAVADLRTAVGIVSAATHLSFVFDGTTGALPSSSWLSAAAIGPDGWPPVLIGWEHAGQSDINLSGYAAAGTMWQASSIVSGGTGFGMAAGAIAFNVDHTELSQGFGVRSWGEAYLHELGHLVGLGHVNDPTQMMNPSIPSIAARYGAGDLTGLARLGSGSCLSVHGR
jgi:hypothetical protein